MKMFYSVSFSLVASVLFVPVLIKAMPASAEPNVSDITGPNVSDITGPNVSDITGPNTSDNTGNQTDEARQYTLADADLLADEIDEAIAACGGTDCPEVLALLENANAILSE